MLMAIGNEQNYLYEICLAVTLHMLYKPCEKVLKYMVEESANYIMHIQKSCLLMKMHRIRFRLLSSVFA